MAVEPAPPPQLGPPSASRLTPSHRPGVVVRPRLIRRLRSAAESPVFVVTAPAGYGKTTLLAQAVAEDGRATAWVTLGPQDDDPIVLLHDLVHALGHVAAMDAVTPALARGRGHAIPVILPRMLAALQDGDLPLAIVLDDVHHLRSPESLHVLHALCAEAPPGVAIYLASRVRPALPLERLRAAGRLWDLRAADLRMTAPEGTAMLRAAGAELEDAEGAFVVERAEGWPAAIYLAARMLRESAGTAEPAPGPSEADLSEYFRDEVLVGAPPADADFLLRTSILRDLDPAICDAVVAREDSADRLKVLAESGFFVTPGVAPGEPYRVHGLFRAMLAAELAVRHRTALPGLHARAARAYRAAGDPEQAIRHALAAGDPETAADICWEYTPAYASHGRGATLERWHGWFTEDQIAAHPHAALGRGWAALHDGDPDVAAHCAAVAMGGAPGRELEDGVRLVAMGRLLRAALGERGLAQARADADRALAGIPPEHATRGIAHYLLSAAAMHTGDRERARAELEVGEPLVAGVMPTIYGLILARLALLEIEDGRWDRAEMLTRRAHGFQRAAGVDDYAPQALVLAVHALVRAQLHDVAGARRDADHAARTLALTNDVVVWHAVEIRLILACAYGKLRARARGRALLEEARRLSTDDGPLLRAWEQRARQTLAGGAAGSDEPELTTAELRTLQYLPTHLSLREIGERLFVTRNTVKTHTIAIYRKLGVSSRSEAVVRGRELGLLDG